MCTFALFKIMTKCSSHKSHVAWLKVDSWQRVASEILKVLRL